MKFKKRIKKGLENITANLQKDKERRNKIKEAQQKAYDAEMLKLAEKIGKRRARRETAETLKKPAKKKFGDFNTGFEAGISNIFGQKQKRGKIRKREFEL